MKLQHEMCKNNHWEKYRKPGDSTKGGLGCRQVLLKMKPSLKPSLRSVVLKLGCTVNSRGLFGKAPASGPSPRDSV